MHRLTLLGLVGMLFIGSIGCEGDVGAVCFQDNECKSGLECCGATQTARGTCQTREGCVPPDGGDGA